MPLSRFVAAQRRAGKTGRVVGGLILSTAAIFGLTGCYSFNDNGPTKVKDEYYTAPVTEQENKPEFKIVFAEKPIKDANGDTQELVIHEVTADQLEQEGLAPLQLLDRPHFEGQQFHTGLVLNAENSLLNRVGETSIRAILQERQENQSPVRFTIDCADENVTASVLSEAEWNGNAISTEENDHKIIVDMPVNDGTLTTVDVHFSHAETGSGLGINKYDLTPLCEGFEQEAER